MPAIQRECLRFADLPHHAVDLVGIDAVGRLARKSQQDRAIGSVAAAGQGKRAVKVDKDLRDGLERLVSGELVDKAVCGTHRSHCVRARWPETDLEQIECADEQGTRSGGW
jgi:hypothetical protein